MSGNATKLICNTIAAETTVTFPEIDAAAPRTGDGEWERNGGGGHERVSVLFV